MSRVRVCFLGTPDFAVRCLDQLVNDEHYEIVGVITQPDRPAGRKLKLQPSPVKLKAQEYGLKVISPESVNTIEVREEVASWRAEVAVVVAFGQILGAKFLELFRFGAVNVHGSILPRWRGAAPIQRAIEAGDRETGVALQRVVKKLDAGDIIGVRRVPITDDLDAVKLYEILAELGADLLHVELMDYVRGNLTPTPQDEDFVTHAPKIDKDEAWIDWSLSAREIFNKMRAFTMGPGVKSLWQGKPLKIHSMEILSEEASGRGRPGEFIEVTSERLVVATGRGELSLLEVQPDSKKRMPISDFLRGQNIEKGMGFDSPQVRA